MRFGGSFCSATIFAWVMYCLPASFVGQAVKVGQSRATPLIGPNSLSVNASPSALVFNLVAKGESVGNSPINITTAYSGLTISGNLSLYAFFISSAAALAGNLNTAVIPSSAFFGRVTTGLPTTYMAFTQTNPVGGAGASLRLISQLVLAGTGNSRTDVLSLKIDLTNIPELPADTYTGTLILQAQAP
jgi:hypothetical protein